MKKIHVIQKKSVIRCTQRQRECIKALGLRHIGHAVEVDDTASMRGLLVKIAHLISISS